MSIKESLGRPSGENPVKTKVQALGVGSPAVFYLHEFGRLVQRAFGECPILVGSALRANRPRDIDIRVQLSRQRFNELFGHNLHVVRKICVGPTRPLFSILYGTRKFQIQNERFFFGMFRRPIQAGPAPGKGGEKASVPVNGFVKLFNGKDMKGWKRHPLRRLPGMNIARR
jgi:hypothetical protein